jgi:hypothetical protein
MLGFASAQWLRFVFLSGGQVGFVSQPPPRPPHWLRSAISPASIWRRETWGDSRRAALPRRTPCKSTRSIQAPTIPTRPPLWNRKGAAVWAGFIPGAAPMNWLRSALPATDPIGFVLQLQPALRGRPSSRTSPAADRASARGISGTGYPTPCLHKTIDRSISIYP